MRWSRQFYPLILAAALVPACFAGEARPAPPHAHLYVTGAGMLLLAGGGALAYYQDRAADRDMSVYRKSAFTDNSVSYRESVKDHERLTWVGLAGAALGGLLVMVSF